jgi:hypothetical protein
MCVVDFQEHLNQEGRRQVAYCLAHHIHLNAPVVPYSLLSQTEDAKWRNNRRRTVYGQL